MTDIVIKRLNERVKELNCLYKVIELLRDDHATLGHIFRRLCILIPPGYQYPTICVVRITYEDQVHLSEDFLESQWSQNAEIVVDDNVVGKIEVFYTQLIREMEGSQFLAEEQKMLNTISQKIEDYLFRRKLKKSLEYMQYEKEVDESEKKELLSPEADEHWKWRMKYCKLIAEEMDFIRFGIQALYIIGSTKTAEAGPASDIDLLAHFRGNENQKNELKAWIEGWGLCLSEMNYNKTGYKTKGGLIDLHLITDEDIERKTSYAVMIGNVDNSARLLKKI